MNWPKPSREPRPRRKWCGRLFHVAREAQLNDGRAAEALVFERQALAILERRSIGAVTYPAHVARSIAHRHHPATHRRPARGAFVGGATAAAVPRRPSTNDSASDARAGVAGARTRR